MRNVMTSAGTRVMASTAEKRIAKFFVNASGLNSRPSWASRVKTGMKATAMTTSEAKIVGPTSFMDSMRTSSSCLSSSPWTIRPAVYARSRR